MYKEELANAQKEIHRLRNTVKSPEEIPEFFAMNKVKETTKTTKRKYTQVQRSIQKKDILNIFKKSEDEKVEKEKLREIHKKKVKTTGSFERCLVI